TTIGRVAFEGARRRKDGTLIQVSIKGGPIVLRGQPIGYYAMYRDITERKRKEAELLHKTALLDELFEGSPDAVVLMDLEARVLRISREFAALFGYSAEEAAGRPVVDLIVPEDELEDSRAGFARVGSGERFVVERERRRKDGTRIHVSIKRAPIVLGGKPIGYYGIYRDITERRRAEEALRLSEERYALAMLAAEDAHWDWIVGTDQYYLSPRSLDLFGLPPDTVFTSREDYLARTPLVREDLEKWQRAVAELFAGTGSRLSMELRAIVRGEIRWLQHIGVCVRDTSGRPVRWCGTARDITERRRTDEALRLSEERYARAMEGSDAGHWEWNLVTEEMFVSARARELLALPPGALPASRAEIMALVPQHPDDLALMPHSVRAGIESGGFERDYRVL
ncbi:MAG TPA: PAS domain S-box protein, partial [Steroidobacteraceae bacterium]